MSGDRIQSDPLFQGIARPTMIAGVSYMYFLLNAMITLVGFINTKDFLVLFVLGPVVHGFGYLMCMKEPRAVELFMLRMKHGFRSFNRFFHGNTNSYDTY